MACSAAQLHPRPCAAQLHPGVSVHTPGRCFPILQAAAVHQAAKELKQLDKMALSSLVRGFGWLHRWIAALVPRGQSGGPARQPTGSELLCLVTCCNLAAPETA